MKELMSSPDIGELEVRIAIQIALSQIFAAGGENLDQTLTSLRQAYTRWVGQMRGESTDLILDQLTEALESEEKNERGYEFNRLFIGPESPPAPPYESVYRTDERLVMQQSTLDVRKWYQAEKLNSSSPSNEPDDFIATELEFAAYLLSCALELYQQNQGAQALDYIQKYNAFWRGHLGLWLPGFVYAVSSSTTSEVFKVLGEILILTVTPIHQGEGGLS